jgi:hypothetical protein
MANKTNPNISADVPSQLRWLADLASRRCSVNAGDLFRAVNRAQLRTREVHGGNTHVYHEKRVGIIPLKPGDAGEIDRNAIKDLAIDLGALKKERGQRKDKSNGNVTNGNATSNGNQGMMLSMDAQFDILATGSTEEREKIASHTTDREIQDLILQSISNPDFKSAILKLMENANLHPDIENSIIATHYEGGITDSEIRDAVSKWVEAKGSYVGSSRSRAAHEDELGCLMR